MFPPAAHHEPPGDLGREGFIPTRGKKENVIEEVIGEYGFHGWGSTCKREGTEISKWTSSLETSK